MTELVLLRHGETDWNRERRIQGQRDTPLAEAGLRQAHAAARRLAAEADRWGLGPGREAALVSSDLQRCRQTAEPIAAALGLACAVDARLRERAFGPFEGRTWAELHADGGEGFDRWHSGDPDARVDGAESMRAFATRIGDALDALAEAHRGRTLVVVTHGGVLDVVWRLVGGLPLGGPRAAAVPNAGLNRLRRAGDRFEVLAWGDVAHWHEALDEPDRG